MLHLAFRRSRAVTMKCLLLTSLVCLILQLARVAYHCLQHDPDLRPPMSVVVKALQTVDLQKTAASETDQISRR